MSSQTFSIRDEFPPVEYDRWRADVERTLKGVPFDRKLVTRTYDGIEIQPVYIRGDQTCERDPAGFPGLAPFVRGANPLGAVVDGWKLCQEHAHPDSRVTSRAIRDDLAGGVNSILLRFDAASRGGVDADSPSASSLVGCDGLPIFHVDDLDEALIGVDLGQVELFLNAGAAFLPAGAILFGLWQRRQTDLDRARGGIDADPLGVLAQTGRLPMSLDSAFQQMADLAQWTSANFPRVTSILVDTSAYHFGGATTAQDIAFAAATGVEYLRVLTAAGMDVNAAARQLRFRFSLGTNLFRSIAKLRAARKIWSRVIQASGGARSAGAMRIQAGIGGRVLTRRDPYVNLLRNTVGVFSAGIGGADEITSVPFDHAVGLPDDFSRRIARSTPLILEEESHLNRVIDPVAGSWFLERLTEEIAEKAWCVFRDVEREGGMRSVIQSGWLSSSIDAAYEARASDVACRKQGITGVNEFPDAEEQPIAGASSDAAEVRDAVVKRLTSARRDLECLQRLADAREDRTEIAVQAAAKGASIGQLFAALGGHKQPTDCIRIQPRRLAEPFEKLRDASDVQANSGQRPAVFLANMGPVSHHIARATFAKNFFEVGGFEVLGNGAFADVDSAVKAFSQSGASIAVICSSDELYPDHVPELATRLRGSGAKSVVLAGKPCDRRQEWMDAGVSRFIFLKCDALATLRDVLDELGVSTS